MEIFEIVLSKIGTMYSLIVVGYILFKLKLISNKIIEKLTFCLIWIINPIIILGQYQIEFSVNKLLNLIISFVLSVTAMIFGFVLANKFSKENTNRLGLGFPNSGFIGIPLVTNIIGVHGVFYLSAYLAAFNIFAYTYGIYLITKRTTYISVKKIIRNPGIIAVITGIMFFVFSIKIPTVFDGIFSLSLGLNTPVAMIILGTYIAKIDLIKLITDKTIYFICFLKLMVIPMLTLVLFMCFPFVDNDIRKVVLLATCTPVGLTATLYSQLFGGDYIHAARLVGMSTILSLFSIPVFTYFMELLIR